MPTPLRWPAESPQHLVHRYPALGIPLGAPLVVAHGQRALIVANGRVCDELAAGTYTVSIRSLPLLAGAVELPRGGLTPLPAELWFVSRARKRIAWRTSTPVRLRDPQLAGPVEVTGRGEWAARVDDPRTLLREMLGGSVPLTAAHVEDTLTGEILQSLSQGIAQLLWSQRIGIHEVPEHLGPLSAHARQVAAVRLKRFGISVTDIVIDDLTIPSDAHPRAASRPSRSR